MATWSPDGQLLAFVDPTEGVGAGNSGVRNVPCVKCLIWTNMRVSLGRTTWGTRWLLDALCLVALLNTHPYTETPVKTGKPRSACRLFFHQ